MPTPSNWQISTYLKAVWRWWWLVVLVTALAAGTSFLVSRKIEPTYRASVTLMVGEDSAVPQVTQQDLATAVRMVNSYTGLVKRQAILEAVVKNLRLNVDWRDLQENQVLVVPTPGTQIFEVRVTDSNPQRARDIANEIARQLIAQSPAAANVQMLAERRAFAQTQMDQLQASIQQAEAAIKEKQAAIQDESSARAVMDLKDDIRAQQLKVADWRAAYTALATSFPVRSPNAVTVLEAATIPPRPVGPNVLANVGMAGVAGLLLALAAIVLLEYLKSSKVAADGESASVQGLPTLGAIVPVGPARGSKSTPAQRLVAIREPHSPAAEAYRVLRTNVQFAWGSRGELLLLVTSPLTGEGKTLTSANLAASLARAGKRTILVDADLRHPSLAAYFGPEVGAAAAASGGLAALLRHEPVPAPTGEVVAGTLRDIHGPLDPRLQARLVPVAEEPNLWLLPAGDVADANPGELLASAEMEWLVASLRGAADAVVIDSPPVLPVADATILGSTGARVVLVAEAGRTTNEAVRRTREILDSAQIPILGIVLNRVAGPRSRYYTAYPPQPQPRRRFALSLPSMRGGRGRRATG